MRSLGSLPQAQSVQPLSLMLPKEDAKGAAALTLAALLLLGLAVQRALARGGVDDPHEGAWGGLPDLRPVGHRVHADEVLARFVVCATAALRLPERNKTQRERLHLHADG